MTTQCYEHVYYQLPNELTRVIYLLNAIECKDPGLNVAIATVKGDKETTLKMKKFKDSVAHLSP